MLVCTGFILCLSLPATADQAAPLIQNNFGSGGLIEMPSARMAPDGELSIGASFLRNTQHYNFGFEILPWLEGSFRYSGLQHFDAAYRTYYDRAFGVKARLWDQSDFFPALAVGINDLVGTGIYSGEYIVATKQIGAMEASLGIGWGRLGSTALFRNPLAQISPSAAGRPTFTTPGGSNFDVFFRGPDAGLFGGVIWHTPVPNLSLMAEYSSDTYALEKLRGNFTARSQMNYGASYQITDGIALGLSWLYGSSISGNLSFRMDPTRPGFVQKLDVEPPLPKIRTAAEQQQALAGMLRRGSGGPGAMMTAYAEKNAFVDALWRQPNIEDVGLNGRDLALAFQERDAVHHCASLTALVLAYHSDVRAVTVSGTAGKPIQCDLAVPKDLATAARFEALLISRAAKQPGLLPAQFLTIDAAGPTPPDIPGALAAIRTEAERQHIQIEALSFTRSEAAVYYVNTHYFAERQALDRLVRILMARAPPDIESFRIIAVGKGVPQSQFLVLRAPQERAFTQQGAVDMDSIVDSQAPAPLQNPVLSYQGGATYPRFSWALSPRFRQQLFDPSRPFAVQLAAGLNATLELGAGISLQGEAETSLYDNFSLNRASDSELPHVRSDFVKYFVQGKTGIGNLEGDYRFRLAPGVFAVAKAGYLESMFAGTGGEILWRPQGQRWALGVDGYQVWQRNFDRLFGLQPYHVFTGHISLYYASPWYDLNFVVRAGQYLAGDRGLTFEVTRRFSTGVEIGAFMTKTNISSARFGEGSFDKGIVIRIPLGWALPIETQSELRMDLRPVQRDGGQRLDPDATLFEETRRASEAELDNIE